MRTRTVSARLSAAGRGLKPFQVGEGKTEHSLCHVGIPNPGQLLRRLEAARGALRMFPAARATVEGERPEARHSLPQTLPFSFITRLNHRLSVCGEVPADSWKHELFVSKV